MKIVLAILLCTVLLAGCNAQETFETISDDAAALTLAEAASVQILIPEGTDVTTVENSDGSKLYLCGDYTVALQTLEGGDLNRTFRTVSGYGKDALTVMRTEQSGAVCYESAWCAAGEEGEQTCRGMILDDGKYHYAVTVMADYTRAGSLKETWDGIFNSVTISIG